MSTGAAPPLEKVHRFLDEAGDTTFFGKGRVPMLGREGVSLSFGLGMVKFAAPVAEMRAQVANLCRSVEADDYVNRIPSVVKRVQSGGFYFRSSLVVDLYDAASYEGSRNYYTPKRPLTAENELGLPVS
jgi:hypothetical protein